MLACALPLPEADSFLHKCFHLGGTTTKLGGVLFWGVRINYSWMGAGTKSGRLYPYFPSIKVALLYLIIILMQKICLRDAVKKNRNVGYCPILVWHPPSLGTLGHKKWDILVWRRTPSLLSKIGHNLILFSHSKGILTKSTMALLEWKIEIISLW